MNEFTYWCKLYLTYVIGGQVMNLYVARDSNVLFKLEIYIMQKSKSFVHILPTKGKRYKRKAKEVENVEKF